MYALYCHKNAVKIQVYFSVLQSASIVAVSYKRIFFIMCF